MSNKDVLRALMDPRLYAEAAVLVAFVVAFGALLWMLSGLVP